MQYLTQEQKELRFRFVASMLMREQDEDNNLYNKILWTDEASFTTSGIYNRRNTNYWAAANPHKYEMTKFQGRSSLNVWCGMLGNQIIGPLFNRGSLTGQRYLQFLQTISSTSWKNCHCKSTIILFGSRMALHLMPFEKW